MVESVVDIVGESVVDDLGDDVNGGEDTNGVEGWGWDWGCVVEGVGDVVGDNVEDIAGVVVGIDVLSLFLTSLAST